MGETAGQVGVLTYLAEEGRGRGGRFQSFLLYTMVLGFSVALYESLDLWKYEAWPGFHYHRQLPLPYYGGGSGLGEFVRLWLQFLSAAMSGVFYGGLGFGAVQACWGRRRKFAILRIAIVGVIVWAIVINVAWLSLHLLHLRYGFHLSGYSTGGAFKLCVMQLKDAVGDAAFPLCLLIVLVKNRGGVLIARDILKFVAIILLIGVIVEGFRLMFVQGFGDWWWWISTRGLGRRLPAGDRFFNLSTMIHNLLTALSQLFCAAGAIRWLLSRSRGRRLLVMAAISVVVVEALYLVVWAVFAIGCYYGGNNVFYCQNDIAQTGLSLAYGLRAALFECALPMAALIFSGQLRRDETGLACV